MSIALLARCAVRTLAVARLVRYLESAGAAAE
jgi:hypothetical protein